MNLAYKYPTIFWNCACLISDAGGGEDDDIDEEATEELKIEESYSNEMEEFNEEEDESINSYDEEDCDGYPAEVCVTTTGKKKKKVKTTNYGKISSAIGKFISSGISVSAPDINESSFTFSPDVEHNTIRYGLSGITRIGEDLIKTIINNRPYTDINDFLSKIKVTKPQMINLIKSGAFDCFGDRIKIMKQYVVSVSDCKKRITLQNMKMLIDFDLIPDEYDMERRVFNFNKYLKKMKIGATYYGLDNIALHFYEKNFDTDKLVPSEETESSLMIKQTDWDKIYKYHMDIVRPYVKENNLNLLNAVNNRLMSDTWNKYCEGSISNWEMSSISCYIHNHELEKVNLRDYHATDFFDLYETPEIERIITIKGKQVPLFKIERIMGTVLDRNKAKKTITLLTTGGVVNVKIYGDVFAHYDKQISQRGADGKKHVIEKSWFSRGNKIIVTGIRRDDMFLAKKYSRTPWHLVELITNINEDGILETRGERAEVNE